MAITNILGTDIIVDGPTTINANFAQCLLKDGTIALTANWDAGAKKITSAEFSTDTISEEGSGNGVTIDGVLLKDSQVVGITGSNLVDKSATEVITGSWSFDLALTGKEIATPSNPASGYNKLYFKTDDYLYSLDSDGNEDRVGDVQGPVSSTDHAIARWNSTSGDTLLDSGVILDDSDNISGLGDFAQNITFDTTARTIAGIANANLIDKTDYHFFGETGADGAKTVSSSENLDFDSANVLVKNYTTLTINASQILGATNVPAAGGVMILKVSGNCVINGGIDMGSQGGDKGVGGTVGAKTGTDGTAGYLSGIFDDNVHFGANAVSGDSEDGGAGGGHQSAGDGGSGGSTAGAAISTYDEHINQYLKAIFFAVGSGGGGGAYDGNNGGDGGDGAGVIILEVGGDLTFGAASTLDADGGNGVNGTGNSGAGGGGSGAQIYVLYNGTLTDGGVTVDVGGGAKGQGGANPGVNDGGKGGDGDYYIAKNYSF